MGKTDDQVRAYYMKRLAYWMKHLGGDQFAASERAERETKAKYGYVPRPGK